MAPGKQEALVLHLSTGKPEGTEWGHGVEGEEDQACEVAGMVAASATEN